MTSKAVVSGLVLVVLGVVVSLVSDSQSFTSWLPAIVGGLLVILGVVGRAKPELSHHSMHIAAALALLTLLGSIGSATSRGASGWSGFSQIGTAVVCGVFLYFAIQSFREARKARTAEADTN